MKYKDWLNDWINLYVKPTTKIRTYEKYRGQVKLHIIPELGKYHLEDLTAITLQKFTISLSDTKDVSGVAFVLTKIAEQVSVE